MEDLETVGKATLDSLSIPDLRVRLALLTQIIKEAQADGDPRWEEAARQQRVVNEVLVRKIKEARRQAGEPEPKPVMVGMQAARMKLRQLSGR